MEYPALCMPFLSSSKYQFMWILGEGPKESALQKVSLVKQKSSIAEPIVIPIVLKMADFDHKVWFILFLSSIICYDVLDLKFPSYNLINTHDHNYHLICVGEFHFFGPCLVLKTMLSRVNTPWKSFQFNVFKHGELVVVMGCVCNE